MEMASPSRHCQYSGLTMSQVDVGDPQASDKLYFLPRSDMACHLHCLNRFVPHSQGLYLPLQKLYLVIVLTSGGAGEGELGPLWWRACPRAVIHWCSFLTLAGVVTGRRRGMKDAETHSLLSVLSTLWLSFCILSFFLPHLGPFLVCISSSPVNYSQGHKDLKVTLHVA